MDFACFIESTHISKEQTKEAAKTFTFISALGPDHWPRKPFGPKNECLDKVSCFGKGILTDLQVFRHK